MTTHQPDATESPSPSNRLRAPREWTFQLGAFPPMRMPLDIGGYLVHHIERDPSGACVGFRAVWRESLDPTNTRDGEVVLQLHTPENGDPDEPVAEHRVAVSVWLARRQRWVRLRTWPQAGPGWPHQVAPWLHAALASAPAAARTEIADTADIS